MISGFPLPTRAHSMRELARMEILFSVWKEICRTITRMRVLLQQHLRSNLKVVKVLTISNKTFYYVLTKVIMKRYKGCRIGGSFGVGEIPLP